MPVTAIVIPYLDPVLLEFGPFRLHWYALAYVIGIAFAWLYGLRMVKNQRLFLSPIHPRATSLPEDLVLFGTLGMILGGRLGYAVFYDPLFFIFQPLQILAIWNGGMSFHGAVIGLTLSMFFCARIQKLPFLYLADIIASLAPLGIFLGRIGNFINAEILGSPSNLPWAVIFSGRDTVSRHPTQIYEALLEGLLLFLVLQYIVVRYKALSWPGLVLGAFALLYGIVRIFSEFFRAPDPLDYYQDTWFSMGILLSIPMIFLGLFLIARALKNGPSLKWE